MDIIDFKNDLDTINKMYNPVKEIKNEEQCKESGSEKSSPSKVETKKTKGKKEI